LSLEEGQINKHVTEGVVIGRKKIRAGAALAGSVGTLAVMSPILKAQYKADKINSFKRAANLDTNMKAFAAKTYQAQKSGRMSTDAAEKTLKSLPSIYKSNMIKNSNYPKKRLITDSTLFGVSGAVAAGSLAGANTKEGRKNFNKDRSDFKKKYKL
jgi:hypothetical protein